MQTGPLDLSGQALMAAAAAWCLFSARRLHARGRRWPARRTAAFLGGLAVAWVAGGSRLAAYDDTSVTAHVVQHVLLMMVAPPLLVLGRPLVLASQAAGRRTQVRLARLAHGGLLRLATNPLVTWIVYLGSMAAMLANRTVYDYLVGHPLAHAAAHVWALTAGVLYWESLLGAPAGRLSYPLRVVSVLANMPFEVLVGLWLRYQLAPLDPAVTLADTQRAGEAFVVAATLVSTVWLVAIIWQWAGRAIREERRAAVAPRSGEWTTPWWVTSTDVSGSAGGP